MPRTFCRGRLVAAVRIAPYNGVTRPRVRYQHAPLLICRPVEMAPRQWQNCAAARYGEQTMLNGGSGAPALRQPLHGAKPPVWYRSVMCDTAILNVELMSANAAIRAGVAVALRVGGERSSLYKRVST